jgi:hypothetical protein
MTGNLRVVNGNAPQPLEPPDVDDHHAGEWRAADLFEARDSLGHIREFARARRVSPLSTLGVVLVRAACHIPPHVALEPLVGGHGSLNTALALVGPPGSGKGASEAAARDAITFVNPKLPKGIPEFPIGSGEGIARTFADAGAETIHTAIFTAAEVDTLTALFRRQGSTLESELRKVWMGEHLGFTNAQKATRTDVPRLSYRAGVIIGVQPLRAGALLNGADGGTPQRIVWMPVLDADMPQQRPKPVAPLTVTVPVWPTPEEHGQKYVVLGVPSTARDAIDTHQLALHHGDLDADPLGGHALLARLKVATALMVLDGHNQISDDDWTLAGRIMAVSNATRAHTQRAIADKARRARHTLAEAAAEHDDIVSDRKLTRCKQAILRWLAKPPKGQQHVARNELRRKLRHDLRPYFDAAIAELIETHAVAEVRIDGGTAYTACTPRTRRTPQMTSTDSRTPQGVPPYTPNGKQPVRSAQP